jgi:hypothetical protein
MWLTLQAMYVHGFASIAVGIVAQSMVLRRQTADAVSLAACALLNFFAAVGMSRLLWCEPVLRRLDTTVPWFCWETVLLALVEIPVVVLVLLGWRFIWTARWNQSGARSGRLLAVPVLLASCVLAFVIPRTSPHNPFRMVDYCLLAFGYAGIVLSGFVAAVGAPGLLRTWRRWHRVAASILFGVVALLLALAWSLGAI